MTRELSGDTRIRIDRIIGLKEWRRTLALDKEDRNGMEHSDKSGRFVSKNLADNIETILHGTKKEKEALAGRYFQLSKTPTEFKKVGLSGDDIQTKYGVVSRHKTKNKDHYFSADEWRMICKNLADPKKCIITQKAGRKGFNIYTKIGDSVLVGVQVKPSSKGGSYNTMQTVYRKKAQENETIVYPKDLKNITTAQRSLHAGLNPGTYTADGRSIIIIDHTPEVVNSIRNLFYSILNEATIA